MDYTHIDRFSRLVNERLNPGKPDPREVLSAMKKVIDEEQFTKEECTSIQKFIEHIIEEKKRNKAH